MHLTYQTLAKSRNATAVNVLEAALENPETRRDAVWALLLRGDLLSAECILQHWCQLTPDEIELVRDSSKVLESTVVDWIESDGEHRNTAIDAAHQLELTEAVIPLIEIAEVSDSPELRQQAGAAVLSLVGPLGTSGRANRESTSIRRQVATRLCEAVNTFYKHGNEQLIESFLAVSRWADSGFRTLVAGDRMSCELMKKRLAESDHPGIVELLADALRRKDFPDAIREILQRRDDECFRSAVLKVVGSDPTQTVVRNLDDLGRLACLSGGEQSLELVSDRDVAALIQCYLAFDRNRTETLHLIASVAERDEPGWITTATRAFLKAPTLDVEEWGSAAAVLADGNEDLIESDPQARLLGRLMNLIESSDRGLVQAVREILSPICAETMLEQFDELDDKGRQRLRRIIMLINPDTIDQTRDALRHPVLERRLKAIARAESLAIVDLLSDSFAYITRDDHQRARIMAARAMSSARNPLTYQLLQEMSSLPDCPARDAAMEAIRQRDAAKSKRTSANELSI